MGDWKESRYDYLLEEIKNLANKSENIVVRGKLYWAKVLPEQLHLNTYTDEREWSVDVTPDVASLAKLKAAGVMDKLKEPKDTPKETRKEAFLPLRQKEFYNDPVTKEKKNAKPIPIFDITGGEWDKGEIGNESIADVMIKVNDYGKGFKKGTYVQKIRILKHVPYSGDGFAPITSDDEFFGGSEPVAGDEDAELEPVPWCR